MAEKTKIQWCDSTFNPWIGCTRVSAGCDHCYAAVSTPSRAMGIKWGAGEPRKRTSASTWAQPVKWERNAPVFQAEHGRRQRVFCASLADWLDNQVPVEWLVDLLELVRTTPHLDWLLLTKRVGIALARLRDALAWVWTNARERLLDLMQWLTDWLDRKPPTHVWLGATVVDQQEAERDVPKLQDTPAAVRFLSLEPMLGPIMLGKGGAEKHGYLARRGQSPWHESSRDTVSDGLIYADYPLEGLRSTTQGQYSVPRVDWLICGGESGPRARPMHPDWARSLRDQCTAAGVPFLFKQWGAWRPLRPGTLVAPMPDLYAFEDGQAMIRGSKSAAGRLLDGVEHNGFPEAAC